MELQDYLRAVEGGATLEQLAEQIAATPLFKSIFPETLSNFGFAVEFLGRVFGSEVAPEIHQSALLLVTAFLDEGQNRASVAFLVTKSLDEIEPGHPAYEDFAGAIARFDNQTAVAEHYSAQLPDSAASGPVLADVTSDPASREAGFVAVNKLARLGETFTFTSGIDQLEGTDRDDVFTGILSPQDHVNGGGGLDVMELTNGNGDIDIPDLVNVSNIEKLTIDTVGAFTGDLSDWAGLEEIVAKNVSSLSIETAGTSSLQLNSDVVTAVNVTSAGHLSLNAYKTDNKTPSDTLESVTVSGDTSFFMGADDMYALKTIDASGTSDRNTLFVEAGDELESVLAGSGRDYVVVIGDQRADGFVVDLGDGDDEFVAGSAGGVNSSIHGGAGRDSLQLVEGSWSEMVNSDGASIYSGFEVLSITGNSRPGSLSIPLPNPWFPSGDAGTYNMDLLGIREVRLSSRFIDDVTLWNAAPGTGIEIIDVEVGHLTYVQKGASEADSTADSLTVDLKAFLLVSHPDRYSFGPSGEVHVETLTAHGVEILEIGSYALTNTNLSFSEFTNTITDIQGDSITTLRLRGHSQLEISNFPDTVTTIDAGRLWNGITIGVPNATGSVTFEGSFRNDDFTGGNGDDIFIGGSGADTLRGGGGSDVFVYEHGFDSRLKFSIDPDAPASYDIIVNFDSGQYGDKDVIHLSRRLGMTQEELAPGVLYKDSISNGSDVNEGEADPVEDLLEYIGDGADFFSDGVNDYPIAVVGGGPGHQGVFVFIDVSGDGDFDIWSELIFQVLAGDIDASSFAVV